MERPADAEDHAHAQEGAAMILSDASGYSARAHLEKTPFARRGAKGVFIVPATGQWLEERYSTWG